MLLEATLSYLGIGVQPPTASWGNIIFENQTYFQAAPWLVFFPGAAILALALAFNLVGDALRDILDPTQQGPGMIAYLGRRLVQSLLILLGVSLITFALLYLLPADPVRQIAGRSATPETVENIRRAARPRPALRRPVLALSDQPRQRRSRPLLHPALRGHRADRLAAAGEPAADGRRHRLRGGRSASPWA